MSLEGKCLVAPSALIDERDDVRLMRLAEHEQLRVKTTENFEICNILAESKDQINF
jgi:RecB family endonuclease NucS